MKIEKTKHDHSLTKLLKVAIFAMLMIAPLFASCSQLMYVTFNKNAKDSYYGETINQEQLEVPDTLYAGKEYTFTFNNDAPLDDTWPRPRIQIENLTLISTNQQFTQQELETISNATYINLWKDPQYGNNNYMAIEGISYNMNGANAILVLQFNYLGKQNMTKTTSEFFGSSITEKNYNKDSYLSESFYYGVETMTESPLFNWTQNTALYTGIKAMTDNLQVQTNVIAVLVTYWTILTIIYIIIDIVLALFTKLTHLLVRSD